MGFRDDKNELVGFDIDLAKAAAEKMGCKIEFQPIDWDSKEMELNTGKISLIWNGFTITDDRLASMEFTKPYLNNRQIIVVKDGSDIKSKNDLVGKNVGQLLMLLMLTKFTTNLHLTLHMKQMYLLLLI